MVFSFGCIETMGICGRQEPSRTAKKKVLRFRITTTGSCVSKEPWRTAKRKLNGCDSKKLVRKITNIQAPIAAVIRSAVLIPMLRRRIHRGIQGRWKAWPRTLTYAHGRLKKCILEDHQKKSCKLAEQKVMQRLRSNVPAPTETAGRSETDQAN